MYFRVTWEILKFECWIWALGFYCRRILEFLQQNCIDSKVSCEVKVFLCMFSLIYPIWDNKCHHPSVWIDGICNTGAGILGILLIYHHVNQYFEHCQALWNYRWFNGSTIIKCFSNQSETFFFTTNKYLHVYHHVLYYIFKIWCDTYIVSSFTYVIWYLIRYYRVIELILVNIGTSWL